MWIKVSTELRHSPKLYAIASHMNVTQVTALGAVCHAWMLADSHASENGFLEHLNFDSFNDMVGIEKLGEAMNLVGWLEEVEGGLNFVNYTEHNGSTAKKRFEDAERQRKCRANKKAKKDAEKEDQDLVTPVTEACDKSVTREEKNREEKILLLQEGEEVKNEEGYPSVSIALDFAKERLPLVATLRPVLDSLEELTKKWHLSRSANGWITKYGHPMKDWRADLQLFAESWSENRQQAKANEPELKVLKGNNDWN